MLVHDDEHGQGEQRHEAGGTAPGDARGAHDDREGDDGGRRHPAAGAGSVVEPADQGRGIRRVVGGGARRGHGVRGAGQVRDGHDRPP